MTRRSAWLGGLHAPGLVGIWRGLAALSSWWALLGLVWGLVLALVVLRRFRHLIVWVIVASLVQVIGAVLASIAHRPRPFGVEIPTDWGGWAMPSLQVMLLAAGLVAILYTLVPEAAGGTTASGW